VISLLPISHITFTDVKSEVTYNKMYSQTEIKLVHGGYSALSLTCSEFFTSKEEVHGTMDYLDSRLKPRSF
jgi:hypothetical protein